MHLHYSVKPVRSFCKPVCSYLRMNLVVGAYVGCGLVRTFLDIFGQCCIDLCFDKTQIAMRMPSEIQKLNSL